MDIGLNCNAEPLRVFDSGQVFILPVLKAFMRQMGLCLAEMQTSRFFDWNGLVLLPEENLNAAFRHSINREEYSLKCLLLHQFSPYCLVVSGHRSQDELVDILRTVPELRYMSEVKSPEATLLKNPLYKKTDEAFLLVSEMMRWRQL